MSGTDSGKNEANSKFDGSSAFVGILEELDLNKDQLSKRQSLIRDIEKILSKRYSADNRLISYVLRFGHTKSSMSSTDISSLEVILNSVTGAEQINILVHSPGGDGTIVEKIIEMCRAHLAGDNKRLRFIVPNIAKSAATIMALGTDEIIMGYCSELGPIDPQIQIAVSGVVHWVSALAFIEARDTIMNQIEFATKQGLPTIGYMQQLAGLNIPFVQQMEHQTDFCKQTAAKLLSKYMLRSDIKNASKRDRKAAEISEKLLSKQLFPVHGHFINGLTAKNELDLKVDLLDKDDDLWKKIWEYYLRCEIQMNLSHVSSIQQLIKIKLFESSSQSLVETAAPN